MMTYEEAMERVKNGSIVQRRLWRFSFVKMENGKIIYRTRSNIHGEATVIYATISYTPSQSDIDATDWFEI